MDQIKLGDRVFHLVILHKRIRHLHMRLLSSDTIQVSSPLRLNNTTILDFVRSNSLWILTNFSKVKSQNNLSSLKTLNILGEEYKILFTPSRRQKISFDHQLRILTIFTSSFSQSHLSALLSKQLKPLALKLIRKEIIFFQKKFNFKFAKVQVRTVKSRFGSCASNGNLSFNWQIIFFPYDKFQHVILHELAHLTHHNHSHRFWQLLGEYDPHCLANRHWIKREANKHLLF